MNHPVQKIFVTALLMFAMTGASFADVLFAGTRKDPATGINTAYAFIPLLDGGSITVGFATTQPEEQVVITYNAECVAAGAGGSVSIQIRVDGKVAHPRSGGNFVLCGTEKVAAVRQSVFRVPQPGNHTVRVEAAAVSGATSWTLDDSSIAIEN